MAVIEALVELFRAFGFGLGFLGIFLEFRVAHQLGSLILDLSHSECIFIDVGALSGKIYDHLIVFLDYLYQSNKCPTKNNKKRPQGKKVSTLRVLKCTLCQGHISFF